MKRGDWEGLCRRCGKCCYEKRYTAHGLVTLERGQAFAIDHPLVEAHCPDHGRGLAGSQAIGNKIGYPETGPRR